MSSREMVARHVTPALKAPKARSVSSEVVACCLLSDAIRIFRRERPIDDVAAVLTAAADNLDEDAPLAFIRP
jgi:hypothetical protein